MVDPISLKELNVVIKTVLDANLDSTYWVVAEIAELRVNPRGHCYMELVEKDSDSVVSKMRANIWANTYGNISAWFESVTGESLKRGLKAMLNVSVQFHEIYGMSLIVKDIEPRFTLGERAKQKQEVIRQLHADGVMEMNQQLELAAVPQKIAIISSSTAAGYGDFINHLEHNQAGYYFDCTLYQSLMQGNEAKDSIIRALHEINQQENQFDVVVLIRGGGSQIDLDCFDTYELAANIAQFPIPVITGIGHERDQSVADMVAHRSMKTPTAVAEYLVGKLAEYEAGIDENYQYIISTLEQSLTENSFILESLERRIDFAAKSKIHNTKSQLNLLRDKAVLLFPLLLEKQNQWLINIEQSVNLLNPKSILARGYSISKINGESIYKLNRKIKKGDILETTTQDNIITSTVHKSVKNG